MPDSVDDDASRFHENFINYTVVSDADAIRVFGPRQFLRAVLEWLAGEFSDRGNNPRHLVRRQAAQIFSRRAAPLDFKGGHRASVRRETARAGWWVRRGARRRRPDPPSPRSAFHSRKSGAPPPFFP